MKNKVLIAIPNLGYIKTELAGRLLQWQQPNVAFPGRRVPVDAARNEIIRLFLKTDCDKLLMIDSDTIPPENALRDLVAGDHMIISGITNSMIKDPKSGKYVPVPMALRKKDGGYYPHVEKGKYKVDRVGASCLMIDRQVVEELIKHGPLFLTLWDENGQVEMSEDFYFCTRAVSAGYTILAHGDVLCGHAKEMII